MDVVLSSIPAKRYFTIGEIAVLCGVKAHVLRYWEQEFTQLRPMKRRGNRRYYQHHEVLMIRRIRSLLYDQGFTISGARSKLHDQALPEHSDLRQDDASVTNSELLRAQIDEAIALSIKPQTFILDSKSMRKELFELRELLSPNDF